MRKLTGILILILLGLAYGCSSSPSPAPGTSSVPQVAAPLPTVPPQTSGSSPSTSVAPTTAEVGNEVGDKIPPFQIALVNGTQVTSDDILNTGRPAFLFFTATW